MHLIDNKPRGQDVCPTEMSVYTAQMHQYHMYINWIDKGVWTYCEDIISHLQDYMYFPVLKLSSLGYLTVLCLIYITSLLAQGSIIFICL